MAAVVIRPRDRLGREVLVIRIRRARPADAAAIAAVHVASWRTTYPGILPDAYLAGLSPLRLAASYHRGMTDRRQAAATFVAVAPAGPGDDGPRIVGFSSGRRLESGPPGIALAQSEIETLYVLDDWRDQGIGRRLMRAAAAHLAAVGSRSVMLWVLSANPSRWFYQRLGGRFAAAGTVAVGGRAVPQVALLWSPIEHLLQATARADGA
jgi:ribosomal protein S18 acetylase RimI-like enzyme